MFFCFRNYLQTVSDCLEPSRTASPRHCDITVGENENSLNTKLSAFHSWNLTLETCMSFLFPDSFYQQQLKGALNLCNEVNMVQDLGITASPYVK